MLFVAREASLLSRTQPDSGDLERTATVLLVMHGVLVVASLGETSLLFSDAA